MIITLTTDFGLTDPFVGVMKGVILGIAPGVSLIDLTHGIAAYDVAGAAFVLSGACRYFPAGTIHLAVVDPGVGTSRRPLAAAAGGQFFVGPDNGIFSGVFEAGASPAVHWITNTALFNPEVGHTFHGRDIFAPVAAHLARGTPLEAVGPRIGDFIRKAIPAPAEAGPNRYRARVLRVDGFGNIVTNIRRSDLNAGFSIRVGGTEVRKLCSSYAQGGAGEVFAIEGSTGYVELSVNRASAAEALGVSAGRDNPEIELETGGLNH